jgi:F-type H+-transporting ATPase subunit b
MEALGINPGLILAQIISFGILFFVLSKFLFPKVSQALADRRQAIKDTFADQKKMEDKLAELEDSHKKQRTEWKTEANKVIQTAKEAAKSEADSILLKAKTASAREVEQAKIAAAKEADKLKDEILAGAA